MPWHRRGRPGFSILELIVVLTLLGVVLGIISQVGLRMQRAYIRQRAIAQAEATARAAETAISTAFGGARANPYALTSGSLPRIELSAAGELRLVGDFNPADGVMSGLFEDIRVRVASEELRMRWQVSETTESVVAAPVTSIAYTFYNQANAVVVPVSGVVPSTARRVRIVVTVPTQLTDTPTLTRERWIFLRNVP
ncbi:MAG: hypothetical protein RLZZ63_892 [Gemmatimonadota bacterium]|jgi:prepilin-type N-terminal cleavage/methylation domain-containing protein